MFFLLPFLFVFNATQEVRAFADDGMQAFDKWRGSAYVGSSSKIGERVDGVSVSYKGNRVR